MTNIAVIENKISSIEKYLITLSTYKKYSREEIEKDLTIRGAVERYLYLVTQAAIDLAEAIIAFKKLRKPKDYAESFEILKEQDIISAELNNKMKNLTGFRNVITHEYEEISYDIVYDVLQNKLRDIKEFTIEVEKLITDDWIRSDRRKNSQGISARKNNSFWFKS